MHQAPSAKRQTANVKRRSLFVALAAVTVAVGCDKATGPKAQLNNIEGKPTVYAMNGSAITLPAALSILSASPVRIDASFSFDVAFDLSPAGVVQVYPLSRVASELVRTHPVGLQIGGSSFASTLKAPSGGYVYDSVFALPVGSTMLVDVTSAGCGNSFIGQNIRAKLSVDSVNTTTRAIYLHILSNPNCGFRALNQGEPKD